MIKLYKTGNIKFPERIPLINKELAQYKQPVKKPIIAIYLIFTDQTGQRKSNSSFALFSTAITQAPHITYTRH